MANEDYAHEGVQSAVLSYDSLPQIQEEEEKKKPRDFSTPASACGRRKAAIARVRLLPGSGNILVNGVDLKVYFTNRLHQQLITDPLTLFDIGQHYDIKATVTGGGTSGQAGALRLGIARALNNADRENNRFELKKKGFLTRDARIKERKKAGLKKARKASQFSKR